MSSTTPENPSESHRAAWCKSLVPKTPRMPPPRFLSAEEQLKVETDADREAAISSSESTWVSAADAGEACDLALVCESASDSALVEARERLVKAGLRVVIIQGPTPARTYILLTAKNLSRMEEEAEKRQISMKLAFQPTDQLGSRPKSTAFVRGARSKFQLKNGRLFSPLERQRIMGVIVEGAAFRGCAEIDLDLLISKNVLFGAFPIHTDERKALSAAWLGVRLGIGNQWPRGWPFQADYADAEGKWPLRRADNRERRRLLPDLGLNQQPLDAIRSYFGSMVAFYFAWIETYTMWLCYVMWAGIAITIVGSVQSPSSGAASAALQPTDAIREGGLVVYSIYLCFSIALFNKMWLRRRVGLAHSWDVADFRQLENPRPEFLRNFHHHRYWRSTDDGGRGRMRLKNGYYAANGNFVADEEAAPVIEVDKSVRNCIFYRAALLLVLVTALMIMGTTAIMVFRMLMTTSSQLRDNVIFNPTYSAVVGSLLNITWIVVMNQVYGRLAKAFNDLENHRTDTEAEDALILKTFLFQFANRYGALFYIAFIKAQGFSPFNAFGFTDHRGQYYTDMCGAVGEHAYSSKDPTCGTPGGTCDFIVVERNCVEELGTQMITYLVLVPFGDIIKTIGLPMLMNKWLSYKRAKRFKKHGVSLKRLTSAGIGDQVLPAKHPDGPASSHLQHKLRMQISEQMTLPRCTGTFDEYLPKVIQFGYVAMFSCVQPSVVIATTILNVIEMRADAYKFLFQMRRPRYRGADGIGKWRHIIAVLSWFAIIVNAALIVLTSNWVRDRVIVPLVAEREECELTTDPNLVSEEARHLGLNTSYASDCIRNYLNCYANIGGEPWLPAHEYLDPMDGTTRKYFQNGLCDPSSALYNVNHCDTCERRTAHVAWWKAWCLVAVEHLLIALHVCVLFTLPDKPNWVVEDNARNEFRKERLERELQAGKEVQPLQQEASHEPA